MSGFHKNLSRSCKIRRHKDLMVPGDVLCSLSRDDFKKAGKSSVPPVSIRSDDDAALRRIIVIGCGDHEPLVVRQHHGRGTCRNDGDGFHRRPNCGGSRSRREFHRRSPHASWQHDGKRATKHRLGLHRPAERNHLHQNPPNCRNLGDTAQPSGFPAADRFRTGQRGGRWPRRGWRDHRRRHLRS